MDDMQTQVDMERRKRRQEGINKRKAAGLYKGRVPIKVDEREWKSAYMEWKSGKITAREAMQRVGLKPNTFYRRVKVYEEGIDKE